VSEKSEKSQINEAKTKNKSTKESVTKTGHEATAKTKATAEAGAKEVTSKDHYNKISVLHHEHQNAQKTTHRAEKRVTIVQGGRDNAVEIKGKHDWQHQELYDKNNSEKFEKSYNSKLKQLTNLVKSKNGKTVIKGGDSASEKASKTQLDAFKEFTSKEGKQKGSETKTKVKTNEVLIKGGEKLNKKSTGKKPKIVISDGKGSTKGDDHEIAQKLIETNKELTAKLTKLTAQTKGAGKNKSVVKVLKAQVKELTAKKAPKDHEIVKSLHKIESKSEHEKKPAASGSSHKKMAGAKPTHQEKTIEGSLSNIETHVDKA
jgi:hypothetical protein